MTDDPRRSDESRGADETEVAAVTPAVMEGAGPGTEAALEEAASDVEADAEVSRDADTGRFITRDQADDNPEGSVVERVRRE